MLMEVKKVAEVIRERDSGEIGHVWGLREDRLLFTWPYLNMLTMKDTGWYYVLLGVTDSLIPPDVFFVLTKELLIVCCLSLLYI